MTATGIAIGMLPLETLIRPRTRLAWRLRVIVPFAKAKRGKPGAILVTSTFDKEARARLVGLELSDCMFPAADIIEVWLDQAEILEEKGRLDYDWKVKERLYRTPQTSAQEQEEGAKGATLEPIMQSSMDKVALLAQEMFS